MDQAQPKVKWFKLYWWMRVILFIVIVALLATGIIYFKRGSMSTTSTQTKTADTKDEIAIKQYMSSLRGDLVTFQEKNGTYEGWSPNVTAAGQVQKAGSEIKTKLSKDNFVIYALLPTSKLTFCMDKNYTGEVSSLGLFANSCK